MLVHCHDHVKSRGFSGCQKSSVLEASEAGKPGTLAVMWMEEMA
jgi:hypothetical protein